MLNSKHCAFVSFADTAGATIFFQHCMQHPELIFIRERSLRVGWSKAPPMIPPKLATAISQGATRAVYVGNVPADVTDEQLLRDFAQSNCTVDRVRVNREKACAFVHLASVQEAIQTIERLKGQEPYRYLRLSFAKDRCDKPVKSGMKSQNNPFEMLPHLAPPYGQPSTSEENGKDPLPQNRRVVYIGNLDSGVTATDICDALKLGGGLYEIRVNADKHCAFLTFVNPVVAQNMLDMGVKPAEGLFIHGKRIKKIGWAKDVMLPQESVAALRHGATRVLYLGDLPAAMNDADALRADFGRFGFIEKVR